MQFSDKEWRARLSPEAYYVCREKGTERPFTGKWLDNVKEGDYVCTCCGVKIFDSQTKFESHCGWPSFFAQSDEGNVTYKQDLSHSMVRTEILCKNCGSHLGHVFDDGPEPTGRRYCVNSISLDFKQRDDASR